MTTVDDELSRDELRRNGLPDYARCLQLEHTAFAADLREMLVDLLQTAPPHPPATGHDSTGREIADIACGVGLDTSEAYLSAARRGTPPELADRVSFDRSGPLDDLTRAWLAEHFGHRLAAISNGTMEERTRLQRHLHPRGDDYFADSPDALLTYLRFCILARKPR